MCCRVTWFVTNAYHVWAEGFRLVVIGAYVKLEMCFLSLARCSFTHSCPCPRHLPHPACTLCLPGMDPAAVFTGSMGLMAPVAPVDIMNAMRSRLSVQCPYMAAKKMFADFAVWNTDTRYTILLGRDAVPPRPRVSWGVRQSSPETPHPQIVRVFAPQTHLRKSAKLSKQVRIVSMGPTGTRANVNCILITK
jgi:hypothetical protein